MRNDAQLPATSELSYLDASKVSSPAGALSELDVLSVRGGGSAALKASSSTPPLGVYAISPSDHRVGLVAGDTSWPPIN